MGLDPRTPGSRPEPKADALTTALPRRPGIPTCDMQIQIKTCSSGLQLSLQDSDPSLGAGGERTEIHMEGRWMPTSPLRCSLTGPAACLGLPLWDEHSPCCLVGWAERERENVWEEAVSGSRSQERLSGGTDLPNGPAATLWHGERYRAWERKGGRAWLGMRCHMELEGESDSRKGTLMASVF